MNANSIVVQIIFGYHAYTQFIRPGKIELQFIFRAFSKKHEGKRKLQKSAKVVILMSS